MCLGRPVSKKAHPCGPLRQAGGASRITIKGLERNPRPSLKGQCREIFCFRFFSWITFPQAPENNIRVMVHQVHHRCQRHRFQWHRWQNYRWYQQHWQQILPPVPLVLLTPAANLAPVSATPGSNLPPVSTTTAANLAPVSTTPVANNGDNIRLQTP